MNPVGLIRTAVTLPVAVVRRVVGTAEGLLRGSDERQPGQPVERTPAPRPADDAATQAREAIARERDPVEEAAPAEVADPVAEVVEDHIDTEAEVVAEVADEGAEDTPGAQIRVDEPWEGYRRMKVAEVKTRLEGQPREVLAAVELYEATHRARQGILSAVELELKRASAPR